MKSYRITYTSICDTGLQRQTNEDSIYAGNRDDLYAFCLADGMGGCQHGDLASHAVVYQVRQWLDSIDMDRTAVSFDLLGDAFVRTLRKANEDIYEKLQKDGPCGTTVVCLLIWNDQYAVFWLGDSRLYHAGGLFPGRTFRQLTRDDIWQNLPSVECRALSETEQRHHAEYGKLTAAIGTEPVIYPNRMGGKLRRGDVFLLCSDGVYKPVGSSFLEKTTGKLLLPGAGRRMQAAAERIRKEVYAKGAPDNLSVILVKIL